MIDWNRVLELREEVGAEDLEEVVELFLEEVEEVLTRMQNNPNPSRLEEDLHFLKGSALNLGFRVFGDLCKTGETAAAAGAAGDIDLEEVFRVYCASKSSFTDGFERLKAA